MLCPSSIFAYFHGLKNWTEKMEQQRFEASCFSSISWQLTITDIAKIQLHVLNWPAHNFLVPVQDTFFFFFVCVR